MNGHGTISNMNGDAGKDEMLPPPPPPYKLTHQSPIPERKHISREREEERRESSVRNYSPQVAHALRFLITTFSNRFEWSLTGVQILHGAARGEFAEIASAAHGATYAARDGDEENWTV